MTSVQSSVRSIARTGEQTPRSWRVHSLPALPPDEMAGLMDIAPAWLTGRPWHLRKDCDAALLWEYALRHGLDGVIGQLAIQGRCAVPGLVELATHRSLSNALYHEQRLAACRALVKAAHARRAPICVMKGPALVEQAYGESGVRSYNDLDVIVADRAAAMALLEAISCEDIYEKDAHGVLNRLRNPCKVSARWRGCEIEMCYLPEADCDPMLTLVARNRERTLRLPADEDAMPWPDPAVHLLFLIQHMAVNHWFSRLIWYVDLVALVRRAGTGLDMDLVEREIDGMRMRNLASITSAFCRRHIDGNFPVIAAGPAGWRRRLIARLSCRDAVVRQKYTHDRPSAALREFFFVLYVAQLVAYTDAPRWRPIAGARRPAKRFMRAIRVGNTLIEFLLLPMFLFILMPVLFAAWIMSWALPTPGERDAPAPPD